MAPGVDERWEHVQALAADRTLGASETAQRAASLLGGFAREDLPDAVEALLRGHPSMAPLWRLADQMLRTKDPAAAAERFAATAAEDRLAAAVLAPELPSTLITVSCSATVSEAVQIRRPRAVVCMASHPGGEGLQMAGLLSAWTDASVMEDDRAVRELPAEAVVVGVDAVTPTSVINKVRTRDLVAAAAERRLPCFAIAASTKLVPLELPSPEPFEATPLELFTRIALPAGLMLPEEVGDRAVQVRLHPVLPMLLERLDAP